MGMTYSVMVKWQQMEMKVGEVNSQEKVLVI